MTDAEADALLERAVVALERLADRYGLHPTDPRLIPPGPPVIIPPWPNGQGPTPVVPIEQNPVFAGTTSSYWKGGGDELPWNPIPGTGVPAWIHGATVLKIRPTPGFKGKREISVSQLSRQYSSVVLTIGDTTYPQMGNTGGQEWTPELEGGKVYDCTVVPYPVDADVNIQLIGLYVAP